MISPVELAANAVNATSILLAGRNSVHTWWTGIVGCLLFSWVFLHARLYADVTLQGFFIVTSAIGWWQWGRGRAVLQIRRTRVGPLIAMACAALTTVAGYGALLHRFTNAYAPFVDSTILAFSVLGQLLLMGRRLETWWCWILVDTVAVPLYLSRGLYLTALLYLGFWINAVVSLARWRRLERAA